LTSSVTFFVYGGTNDNMSSKVLFIPGFSLEKPSNNGIIIGVKADNDPALTRWSVLEMDSSVTFDKITDVHLISTRLSASTWYGWILPPTKTFQEFVPSAAGIQLTNMPLLPLY